MLNKVNPLEPPVLSFADGGSVGSLLAPEMPMMEEDMGMMDESSPLHAVEAILGEEKFGELQMAIEAYPVVQEVVDMAIQTSDGEVSGMGSGTSDSVPARVSDGEFIFPAGLVEEIGVENLQQMLDDYHSRAGSMAV